MGEPVRRAFSVLEINLTPMRKPLNQNSASAFSLVEITLALGITAFALLAILGLLPVGLKSAQDSNEQARATDILNLAATGVEGQYYLGTVSGNNNYAFANFISDNDPVAVAGDNASPWPLHTKYFVGQSSFAMNFPVLGDLSIRKKTDNSTARYQLYINVSPPTDSTSPVKVYVSVAWPGVATYSATGGWTRQQGYVETTIYASLPPSL